MRRDLPPTPRPPAVALGLLLLSLCGGASGPGARAEPPATGDAPLMLPCGDRFGAEGYEVIGFSISNAQSPSGLWGATRTYRWEDGGSIEGSDPFQPLGGREVESDRWGLFLRWGASAVAWRAVEPSVRPKIEGLVASLRCDENRAPSPGLPPRIGRTISWRWQVPAKMGVVYSVGEPPGGELTLTEHPEGWAIAERRGARVSVSGPIEQELEELLTLAMAPAEAAIAAKSGECPPPWTGDEGLRRIRVGRAPILEAIAVDEGFDVTWEVRRGGGGRFRRSPVQALGPARATLPADPLRALLSATARSVSCATMEPGLQISHAPPPQILALDLTDGTTIEVTLRLAGAELRRGDYEAAQFTGEVAKALSHLWAAAKEAGPVEGRRWRMLEGRQVSASLTPGDPRVTPSRVSEVVGKAVGSVQLDLRRCLNGWDRSSEGGIRGTLELSFRTAPWGVSKVRLRGTDLDPPVALGCMETVLKKMKPKLPVAKVQLRWNVVVAVPADGPVLP